jgi:hypothetical protein
LLTVATSQADLLAALGERAEAQSHFAKRRLVNERWKT